MKKIATMFLTCSLACLFLFTGCIKNMSTQDFEKASNRALENTYEILLTDKTNLSTHGDFTLVNSTIENNYNEDNQVWEVSNQITTIKRVGKGVNTIFEKTEYVKTDDGLGGIQETTTKLIYTAIYSGGETNYYILKEFNANDEEVVKSIYKTYLTESSFINDVYNLVANNLMQDLYKKFYFSGENILLSLATGVQPVIKGNQSNCQFSMSYNLSNFDNSSHIIERSKGSLKINLKDSKFDKYKATTEEFENGIKYSSSVITTEITYSADLSRVESIDFYN